MSPYEIVGHTSEVALKLQAEDESGLCRAAGEGLLALYAANPAPQATETREVSLEPKDSEDLLVSWLNELIFLVGTKRWVPVRIDSLEAGEDGLKATLTGAPLGESKLALEIKAATFGGLKIQASHEGYAATVILDV
ncbi:MAG: archease [Elusimicrobia bacterium]|nr:archease [Elusimicrobiota bacterium]